MINLKRKLAALATIGATLVGSFAFTGAASAQSAYATNFVTSITYQNVGTADTTVQFQFYPTSGSAITFTRALPKDAGASIFIGNTSELSGFSGAGSAVMSAGQPVIATIVQVPIGNATVRNRPLSNGFSSDQGANNYLIATVLKNQFNQSTRFSVQNADSGPVSATVKFINAASNPPGQVTHTAQITNLGVGAAAYFDAGTIAELGGSFNGSVTIEANGKVVAAALELQTNSFGASSFEGVSAGANTIYLPSALCNSFGGQTTAYAVQNTSTTADANVTVTYSDGKTAGPVAVKPGAKASFNSCDNGFTSGASGSAVVTSQGAPIVVIGKVFGTGLSTAFVGSSSGAAKLAAPYVRYTQTRFDTNTGNRQRTFIAIQNIGSADLAAGTVVVRYLDKNGQVVGNHSLPAIARNAKVNSNPTQATGNAGALAEFGYYSDGSFGGSAVIEGPAGSQLVAVVRVTSNNGGSSQVGEDYNAIAVN